jgi:MSHA biogenesis protein MshP
MTRLCHRPAQQGFSLVSALFLLVVLGALGAYMVGISGTQHFTTLHALQGVRAYHAARSGVEWGIGDAINNGNCATGTILSGGDLDGFRVEVDCTSTMHRETGNSYNIYDITAFAQTNSPAFGQPGYAARTIGATVTNAP